MFERACPREYHVVVRVFVTRSLPLDPRSVVPADLDVGVSPHDRPLRADEIAELAADADGIVSMLSDPLDAALIRRLPRLKVISNFAVGVNNIDLAAAEARGIAVCNTPDVLTDATADLTMTLLLALARRVREAERLLRSGAFDGWGPSMLLGTSLRGATLGLFGFGRIGRAVARRADAFGLRVAYHTRNAVPDAEGAPGERRPWDEILATADVVSLHAPLTAETRHVVDARALAVMKKSAFLLNTSRGPLVDEAALVKALAEGALAGAGLDVFEHEPEVHPGLLGRDDVVLLPHVGSATVVARVAMARLALESCVAVLRGERPPNRLR